MVKIIEDKNKLFEQILKTLYRHCPIVADRSYLYGESEKYPVFGMIISISQEKSYISFISGTKACSHGTVEDIEIPRIMGKDEIERIVKFIREDHEVVNFEKDEEEFGKEAEFKFDIRPWSKAKGIYCSTIDLRLNFRGNLELGKEYTEYFAKKYGKPNETVDESSEGIVYVSEDETVEDKKETRECKYKLTASKVGKIIQNYYAKQHDKVKVRIKFEHYEEPTTTIEVIRKAYLRGGFHTYIPFVLSEEEFKNIMKEEVEQDGTKFVGISSNLKLASNFFSQKFMEDGMMLADRSFTLVTEEPVESGKVLQKNKNN